jgi:hypothetical protein
MLEGLRRLTGARVALHLQLQNLGTDREAIVEPLDAGFLDADQRALWGHYQRAKAYLSDPFHQCYYRNFGGRLRTRRLDAVVDMEKWRRSLHYNEYVRACGLGDRITSSFACGEQPSAVVHTLVLHRSSADGSYEEHAARLVHIFHDELRPLLGRQLALPRERDERAPLPPQLERVLFWLLRGDGEKRIAERLGISPHTVNRHVQRLYRRFGVRSRGELTFACASGAVEHQGGEERNESARLVRVAPGPAPGRRP